MGNRIPGDFALSVMPRSGGPRRAPQSDPAQAIAHARLAGITAVWTGDCAATVELARLSGPRDGLLCSAAPGCRLATIPPPWRLSTVRVRAALYQCCLTSGTQFDIYRWINLVDLAEVFDTLRIPTGVRSEWRAVLVAARLVATIGRPADHDGPAAVRSLRLSGVPGPPVTYPQSSRQRIGA